MNAPSTVFEALERIFHEPNRLAIMSALAAAKDGLAFTDLRERCRLTDGNLNRHLKVLEEERAIRVRKSFVDSKPQTTIAITPLGLKRFGEYLAALARVLETARSAVEPGRQKASSPLAAARLALKTTV